MRLRFVLGLPERVEFLKALKQKTISRLLRLIFR